MNVSEIKRAWRKLKRETQKRRGNTICASVIIIGAACVPGFGTSLAALFCLLIIALNAKSVYDAYTLENEISESALLSDEAIEKDFSFDYTPLLVNVGIALGAAVIGAIVSPVVSKLISTVAEV